MKSGIYFESIDDYDSHLDREPVDEPDECDAADRSRERAEDLADDVARIEARHKTEARMLRRQQGARS